jgi:TRAP-type C4-dicarboxylate transport system permease small subunit
MPRRPGFPRGPARRLWTPLLGGNRMPYKFRRGQNPKRVNPDTGLFQNGQIPTLGESRFVVFRPQYRSKPMAEAVPQLDDHTDHGPKDRIGAFLFAWARLSAMGGGLVLLGICGVSVYSIVGRWLFGSSVLGDVELVQMGCAVAISAFLPYCQMKNAHVIVDFFTQSASPDLRRILDKTAACVLAALAAVIAMRSFSGAWDAWRYGETSMILGWPLWWSYINIGPGFALLSAAALHTAVKGCNQDLGAK